MFLKINLKTFVTAFDKAFVLQLLDVTIHLAPVGAFCIFIARTFWKVI